MERDEKLIKEAVKTSDFSNIKIKEKGSNLPTFGISCKGLAIFDK